MIWILVLVISSSGGHITGTVRNAQSAKALAQALAEISSTSQTALSDSSGIFIIGPVAPGSYNLVITREGFETVVRNDVYVPGEGDVRIDVEMTPQIQDLGRVTVRGSSFRKASDMAASTKTMSFDEIIRQPGALADVQRAVQDLPSVASGGDNVNEIVVRGGVPGENLFVMDNIDIPNPNHFAQQGSGGGVVSLINPLLVRGLTFCAGAPPAQYGGKASSVLDVQLRDGNDKLILGGLDLGIGGAGAHLEGPLWSGSTFMLSGAKSFLDFVANFDPTTAIPRYWGMQAKLSQRLGPMHKLSLNGIYGDNSIVIDDAVAEVGTRGDVIEAGGGVYATGATLRSLWTSNLSTVMTISGTGNGFIRREYTPARDGRAETEFFRNESYEQEQTLRAEVARDFRNANRLIVGGYLRRADFNIKISGIADTLRDSVGTILLDPTTNLPTTTRQPDTGREVAYKYGAHVSSIIRPLPSLKLIPGIRCDGFSFNQTFTASPRLGAVYTVTPNLDLTVATGVQYQDPDYVVLVASPMNRHLGPKRAITGMGGVEYVIPAWEIKLSAEGFYKRYNGLPIDSSYLLTVPITSFTRTNTLLDKGEGRSYGIELFAQKKLTKRFSGSAAYSWSQSLQQDIRPGHQTEWYPGDYDFRNNVTLSGGWKFELMDRSWYLALHEKLWFALVSWVSPLADRTELSLRFRYLGGRPYTAPVYLDATRTWAIMPNQPLNRDRYEPYHTLDVRWERRFGFGFLQMIYYFEIQNVYNRKNIWQKLFVDGRDQPAVIEQLPFFPAGGMIIGF